MIGMSALEPGRAPVVTAIGAAAWLPATVRRLLIAAVPPGLALAVAGGAGGAVTALVEQDTHAPGQATNVHIATTGALGVDVTETACATPHPAAGAGCTAATLGGLASSLVKIAVRR